MNGTVTCVEPDVYQAIDLHPVVHPVVTASAGLLPTTDVFSAHLSAEFNSGFRGMLVITTLSGV